MGRIVDYCRFFLAIFLIPGEFIVTQINIPLKTERILCWITRDLTWNVNLVATVVMSFHWSDKFLFNLRQFHSQDKSISSSKIYTLESVVRLCFGLSNLEIRRDDVLSQDLGNYLPVDACSMLHWVTFDRPHLMH